MNRAMAMIRVLLVGFGCVVLVAMYCIIQTQKPEIIYVQDANYVQCPAEAQERLKAQGLYDGKIDGIWGAKTDKAYCDWCMIDTMKKYKKNTEKIANLQ